METQNKTTETIPEIDCQHHWMVWDYSDVDRGVDDAICEFCLKGAKIVEFEEDYKYYSKDDYIPGLLLVEDAGNASDELIERYLKQR